VWRGGRFITYSKNLFYLKKFMVIFGNNLIIIFNIFCYVIKVTSLYI